MTATDLYTRVLEVATDHAEHGDSPAAEGLGGALRAALLHHQPEQHYSIGQDGRSRPSYQWCKACRKTAPCPEVVDVAAALGLEPEATG